MLTPDTPLAIFMEDTFGKPFGKMGYGVLRFSANPVVCIVDSTQAGKRAGEVMPATPRPDCPIVASVADAAALGAKALLLGSAPSGGRLPDAWLPALDQAIALGLCIINGLHQRLNDRYHSLAPGQWIWDIRQEPANIGVGKGRARELTNKRLLIVGSDMANGKMTSGLLIAEAARRHGVKTEFLATGQIGIVISGRGVPLDAIKLDYACGAIEQGVMELADADLIVVEGQGSILHPGSTATLPLLRGSCPTHLILNHRADMLTLRDFPWLKIPPLKELAALYEAIASACGTLVPAKVGGITLNTSLLNEEQAKDAIARTEDETQLPTTDCVRYGAEKLIPPLALC
ncbi:MAG: DUF1611 domain-containing protein [Lentisphaerae bacterium]|nr:DUF1611 domain-containing protein [Lentisphaerota bacterium]HQL08701.1 DUF1611 domain-containing protein [Lentisphaeria bacterium]